MELIKYYLKLGNITKHGPQSIQYRVSSMEDLGIFIKFLDAYKLISQKYAYYGLFKKVFLLTKNK